MPKESSQRRSFDDTPENHNQITDTMGELMITSRGPHSSVHTEPTRKQEMRGFASTSNTASEDKQHMPGDDAAEAVEVIPGGTRVLGIIELLEHILMHTEMQTLLLAQRVSRTFFNTITGSIPLQQKLFFVQQPVGQPGDELIINPLILKPSIMGRLAFRTGPSGQPSQGHNAAQEYNHVLFDRFQVLKSERSNKHSGIHLMLHQLLRDSDLSTAFEGWNYPGKGVVTTGSWTRMFLVQQPCITLVKISVDPRREASSSDSSISSIFGADQSTYVGGLLQLPMLFKGTGTPSSNFKTRTMEDRVKALKHG
ncbi:hypothetical protein LTR56_018608 [Elasticomyces elasticus]|nr:hypothetical protein LTR56_018608 [Elasticomyces elasticus]KAK3647364.1 hypothetical protein LTR22_013795 [Elasticomyces elasticus]KAK4917644.1 hypothetical protein LTR49_014466 [Elasticomyces elasticus]KAK5752031.1 hypothetical protein LTS12_017881 [Elasticomyces elasticus]